MHPRLDVALPALAGVLLVALVLALTLGGSSNHSSSTAATLATTSQSTLDGAALPEGVPAPPFTLTDQAGRRLSLAAERGHVTVLAFLYTTCGAPCVLIAQQIRGALDELESEHTRAPAVLIVSADPATDTPARVRSFLAQVSLSGRVSYLTGPPARLRAIWREYGVSAADAGRREFARFAKLLLLDGEGRERDLFEQEQLTPEALSHDIRVLDAGAST